MTQHRGSHDATDARLMVPRAAADLPALAESPRADYAAVSGHRLAI